jgi:hypothetical protein
VRFNDPPLAMITELKQTPLFNSGSDQFIHTGVGHGNFGVFIC